MKNTILSDLGEYFPSFFRMKLSFAFYDNPIAIYRLPPKERGTFIHEYIHFLQDISTHFGLNNMYVYSEYLHSTITQLYKEKKKEIKIPIDPYKQSANLLSNIEINNLCTGDYKSRETLIISDIKEKNYKLKNRNKIIESIPIYQLKSGKEFIHFGGRAIMESMAFLIEQALEPLTVGAKDYPYHAAQNVSDYYIPNFSSDPGRLIALCDVALLMSNPAHLFISYLKYYKHQNIIPSAKDIYDKFYTETHFFSGKPCYAREGLLSFFPKIANYLSTYVHPTLDKGFSTITNFLISKALNFRINRPYLIYELFSAGPLLYNHIFTNILKEFGSPLI